MPLPDKATSWPPKQLASITSKQQEWSAWWGGDQDALSGIYRRTANRPADRPSQHRGGAVGAIARWFWGAPRGGDEPKIRLHVPLAADICQASSDLLFSDPPQITSADPATSAQLGLYLDDGMPGVLSSAAEICAALGGTYLRATFDTSLQGRSFLTAVDADAAWPEFRWGRLAAVTFWWRLEDDGATVWRHLERHETINGVGVVEHGLYRGTSTDLGRRVPLDQRPETVSLAKQVNAASIISTGTPGLDVAYVPNNQPAPLWRQDPIGRNLGVSDFYQSEPLLDSLDRSYSMWMRDLDLAKARIIIPDYMLQTGAPGQGVAFDLDREIYDRINVPPTSDVKPELFQPDVDVDRYKTTTHEWTRKILHTAGYSMQTFGEDEQAGAATATEIVSKDRRTMSTRDAKVRLWQPAVLAMLRKMLAMDAALFRTSTDPGSVTVAFADSLQDTPLQLAQTAQAMAAAQAASTQTRVQLLHPDWDDGQVAEEVARVHAELGIGQMADPLTIGVPVVNPAEPPVADAVAK